MKKEYEKIKKEFEKLKEEHHELLLECAEKEAEDVQVKLILWDCTLAQ